MKLSALLSLAVLGASSTMAFPLFGGAGEIHPRGLYTPIRRTEIPSPTPTEESESVSSTTTDSTSATATATPTETSSVDTTNTYLYSTITATDSLSAEPGTRTETETPETSATTETEYPQATETVSRDLGNVDVSRAVIIRVKETVVIRERIIAERPVLVAVQVNLNVRKTIIVQQIQIALQNRFDNWDIVIVNQLARVIAQQFAILSRAGNRGFDNIDNGRFDQFVSKFVQHFQIFQAIQLVDVQKFIGILQGFDINQLATFFGRSDALFNQDILNQRGINNDFSIFVQQIQELVVVVQSNSFNDDGIFNLGDALLVNGGLDFAAIAN